MALSNDILLELSNKILPNFVVDPMIFHFKFNGVDMKMIKYLAYIHSIYYFDMSIISFLSFFLWGDFPS